MESKKKKRNTKRRNRYDEKCEQLSEEDVASQRQQWRIAKRNKNDRQFTDNSELNADVTLLVTINKSQGQTLEKVGIWLRSPIFTHGQLYVAISRSSSRDGLKILLNQNEGVTPNYTKNWVYSEVLRAVKS